MENVDKLCVEHSEDYKPDHRKGHILRIFWIVIDRGLVIYLSSKKMGVEYNKNFLAFMVVKLCFSLKCKPKI